MPFGPVVKLESHLIMPKRVTQKHPIGERMKRARTTMSGIRNENVGQALMAELVTAELRRLGFDITVSQSDWSRYEKGRRPRERAVYQATENLSHLRAAWLAGFDDATPRESTDVLPGADRARGTIPESDRQSEDQRRRG